MDNNAKCFFFENIINSSYDTSDDDELFQRKERQKIKNFVDVVEKYDDEEFRQNFRMGRDCFETILALFKEKIEGAHGDLGRNRICARTELLMALWYFATPDSYRSICARFDIGCATGFRIVHRVAEVLINSSKQFLRWPSSHPDYFIEVVQGFQRMGFEHTIGCIDGCYIPIPEPKEETEAYRCRKHI